MKADINGLIKYSAQAKCGKELAYYINVNTGRIAISNNPECVMHYMLDCRECAWVKSRHDSTENLASIEHHSRHPI